MWATLSMGLKISGHLSQLNYDLMLGPLGKFHLRVNMLFIVVPDVSF